jgi:hypothetical protein
VVLKLETVAGWLNACAAPGSINLKLDGLLGVTSQGMKCIAFDFEHDTIRWECVLNGRAMTDN